MARMAASTDAKGSSGSGCPPAREQSIRQESISRLIGVIESVILSFNRPTDQGMLHSICHSRFRSSNRFRDGSIKAASYASTKTTWNEHVGEARASHPQSRPAAPREPTTHLAPTPPTTPLHPPIESRQTAWSCFL
eukprot:180760-Rhodomonas_salina.2